MPRLRIIHETNPGKYFPALFQLEEQGAVTLAGAHRYSVAKEWLRAWKRDRAPLGARTRNAWGDLKFRLGLSGISGEVVVMGFAPWDWRLLIYRRLARRNRVLYHTSWHDWGLERTPRQPRPEAFKRWLRDRWLAFLAHPNVDTIAVTPVVADAVRAAAGIEARVIPHAVPQVFFAAGAARRPAPEDAPLKLIYVGEVSEKKGIAILLEMMRGFRAEGLPIELSVVGNGPLAGAVKEAEVASSGSDRGAVRFLGPIYDREKLAGIMAEHDVLMLLSQRTETWEELFGIVVVEALASGLAVVASDHIGPHGILAGTDTSGLFDQDDHAGIAGKLREMAADRGALRQLHAAQVPVAETYGIEKVRALWHNAILAAAGQMATSGQDSQ